MGMNAPRTKKSYLLTVVMVLGLAGCSGLRPVEQVAVPITSDEIPDINWPAVPTVHWLVADYTISPNSPQFQSGQAYRLVIRNTGDRTHVLDGQDFFDALAIKSLTMSAFAGHTGDEHVDEPIGPKGQDGVPKLPVLIDTAPPSGSEADGEDSANPFAADDKEGDSSDPFAAEEKGDGETAGQSSAANPFAEKPTDDSEAPPAKEPVDTDVKVKGLPEPEPKQEMAADDAAKSEPKTIIEDAADDDAGDPAEVKEVASDTDIDDAADNEPTASPDDDDKDVASDDDKDVASDDDKDVASDDDKDVASADDKDVASDGKAWTPLQISEITIESGHETTLEFVAIRPGRYPLGSAHVLPTVFGMFTLATIKAPNGETKTAKAETAE